MEHVPKYWFTLKYFTHNLHAVYRLLNKYLLIYRNEATSKRADYHHLTYGARSFQETPEYANICCIMFR